jgi:hypothetical protein
LSEYTRKFISPDSSLTPLNLEAIAWVMTQRYGVNTIEFEAIQLTTAGSLRKRLRNLYMKGNSEVMSEEGEEKTNVAHKRKRAKRTARKIQRKDQPSIPSLEALQEEKNVARPERSMSGK